MDRQTHKHIDLTCSWIWYHVDMICDLWTRWHDVWCVHTCKSCQHHIVSCVHDTSCWRSLVVQDHVFKSCTVDDHIVNTWWILWKHGWWVPYHLLSLSHVPHIMDTWYRDIMCRYEDISCVMCRYEGRAELCVCVCTTQLTAHVSVSSTLQGHKCHMITFLGPGKSYKCEKSWVSGRPAVGIPVYLHFWAWAETQVSVYRDWAKLPRSYLSISLYKVYQDKISTNSETMSSLKQY